MVHNNFPSLKFLEFPGVTFLSSLDRGCLGSYAATGLVNSAESGVTPPCVAGQGLRGTGLCGNVLL